MTEVLPYAGFWRRLGAGVMDILIFAPIFIALTHVATSRYGAEHAATADFVINRLIPFIVVALLWWRYGATPGKRLAHCRIMDAKSGNPPGLFQAAVRYLGYVASALPIGLGFLWIFWDPRKQGFHDKIAGTVVVYAPEDEALKSIEELVKESR